MSHVLNPTRRNGLRQNEIERKYAKAYESTYMTEQLAKLVVCVSHQTQQLRSRTPTCPVQFPSVSASESHSSSLVRWPKPSKIPRPSTCPVHRTCQREQLLLAVRKTKLQSQSQPSNKRDLRLGSTTAENFTVARTQMITDAKQLNRNESDILVSSSLGLTYFDIHERVERVECDVPLNVFWTYFERTLNVLQSGNLQLWKLRPLWHGKRRGDLLEHPGKAWQIPADIGNPVAGSARSQKFL